MFVENCAQNAREPVSLRLFQEIFTAERNHHFGSPSLDTCKTCDKIHMLLQSDLEQEAAEKLKHEKELHLRKADAAQSQMKADFEKSKSFDDIWTIAFDLQQALPTPHINTSVTFYSRQLWTYNLSVHDSKGAVMHMWSEDIASRGSCEVLSSLNAYFESEHSTEVGKRNTSLIGLTHVVVKIKIKK